MIENSPDHSIQKQILELRQGIVKSQQKIQQRLDSIKELQDQCTHSQVTHNRGAWGGDGYDKCNFCGKEL